jgi:hypothetical protein
MVVAKDILKANADTLQIELDWFEQVVELRLGLYFGQECEYKSIWDLQPPVLDQHQSSYASFIKTQESTPAERLILMLLFAPHIKPQLLDLFSAKNTTYDRGFTEFGGLRGLAHGGFLPTMETALFLLAGADIFSRIEAMKLFDQSHYLVINQVIYLNESGTLEPRSSSAIVLSPVYVNYFMTGKKEKRKFDPDFPARLISTALDWDDLVLPSETCLQLEEIKTWINHHDTLLNEWGFGKKVSAGYRSLFYGPSGTGKTLAACLIGKRCNLEVYRIDLSMVISKYIGETEKNLEKVFQSAANKNWILFFDEADAIFGKRTAISNANDRYANQETAYLLQRIEDYPGVVILASNLKNNIDEAFARRFQSLIYFPVPRAEERLKLWQQSLSPLSSLGKEMDLTALAAKYELTGGMIMNVVRYCSLMAIKKNEHEIRLSDAEKGIQRELAKEGRIM